MTLEDFDFTLGENALQQSCRQLGVFLLGDLFHQI